jgi:hypothetical protein
MNSIAAAPKVETVSGSQDSRSKIPVGRSDDAVATLNDSTKNLVIPTSAPDWQFVPDNKTRRLRRVDTVSLSSALFELRSSGVLEASLRPISTGIVYDELVSLGRGLLKRYTARALIDAGIKSPHMLTVGMGRVLHEARVGLDKLTADLGVRYLLLEGSGSIKAKNRYYFAMMGGTLMIE